MLGINKS